MDELRVPDRNRTEDLVEPSQDLMNTSEGTEIKDAQDALGESVATVVG